MVAILKMSFQIYPVLNKMLSFLFSSSKIGFTTPLRFMADGYLGMDYRRQMIHSDSQDISSFWTIALPSIDSQILGSYCKDITFCRRHLNSFIKFVLIVLGYFLGNNICYPGKHSKLRQILISEGSSHDFCLVVNINHKHSWVLEVVWWGRV